MAKLTRTNFEGFAHLMAELRPNDDPYDPATKQWQRTLHALMAELHDQSGLTPNGNRIFDAARFITTVIRLANGKTGVLDA